MIRVLLVIGENHEELAAQYSNTNGKLTKKVIIARPEDAKQEYDAHKKWVDECITDMTEKNDEDGLAHYTRLRELLDGISPAEYYKNMTIGSEVDKKGNVYVMRNPIGRYSDERCGQSVMDKGEEYSGLSQPFPLLDDTDAFIAKKGEIDWALLHMNPNDVEIYRSAWETCVEGREPKDGQEQRIWNNMKNRHAYFANFPDKETFIKHCTSFWCYGVVDSDGCVMMDDICTEKGKEMVWTSNFYEMVIEPLSDDTVIALYDIKIED